jgi:hypothetical protein
MIVVDSAASAIPQEPTGQHNPEPSTISIEPEVVATVEASNPNCTCVCVIHEGPPAQKASEPEMYLVHDENDEVSYSDWIARFYVDEMGFDEWRSRQPKRKWVVNTREAKAFRRQLDFEEWLEFNSQEQKDIRKENAFQNWIKYNSEDAKEFRSDLRFEECMLQEENRQ